jgi:hypothetical protein
MSSGDLVFTSDRDDVWRAALFSDLLYTINDDLIRWRKHDDSAFAKEARDMKTRRVKAEWIDLNLRVIE